MGLACKCINPILPYTDRSLPIFILSVFTIVADLFFAILPWIFIWKLNIPKREKIILAVSLSLGILYVTSDLPFPHAVVSD